MPARRAFTLIELMLSVALGAVLVYTAVAGVRVASQAVTTSARLSTENALMRMGIAAAHDEVDFWTRSDDPTQADAQRPLKRSGSAKGLAFQPFALTFAPKAGAGEDATGWDAAGDAWSTANDRTWQRGNMVEKDITDLRFGRYGAFASTASSLAVGDFASVAVGPAPPMGVAPTKGYGPVTPKRHWLYRQISGLASALGYYGLCEYLPANQMYVYHGPAGGGTNADGAPLWLVAPGGSFNNWDGGQQTPRGKYRNSYATSYAFVDPNSAVIAGNQTTLGNEARRWWSLGYGADVNAQKDFNAKTAVADRQLPVRPNHWPDVTVSVQRFIKNARHASVCRVRWLSPITGEGAELSFATFGTSLRGARQQRRPDTGWARWDDDGVDHSADPAYKHLDTY